MIWINGDSLEIKRFPNGECVIRNLGLSSKTLSLTWRWEDDKDITELFFVKRHLDSLRLGVRSALTVMYMPYSRMDRVDEESTCFTLKYLCELINELDFDEVVVMEPHSDVTLGLLDRAQGTYPVAGVVEKVLDSITEPVVLVFPDAGAAKRYAKMFAGQEHLIGEKTREFATGKITGLSITKPEAWVCGEVKRAIIVDDLCSRGGTFLEAGQALRENLGFTQVELCVTHLEANVYNGKLLDDGSPIDHIYTTDAMVRGCVDDKKITTYELEKK